MSREPTDIAAEARTLLDALAYSTDPAAFQTLLELSHYIGECVGISARTLAESQSWSMLLVSPAPPNRPPGRGGTTNVIPRDRAHSIGGKAR